MGIKGDISHLFVLMKYIFNNINHPRRIVVNTQTHTPTLNNVERGSHILQNFHKIVILPRD
jgi:hypothetical protein